jgi:hypothetical protein
LIDQICNQQKHCIYYQFNRQERTNNKTNNKIALIINTIHHARLQLAKMFDLSFIQQQRTTNNTIAFIISTTNNKERTIQPTTNNA